jgi:hypothetical protein
MHLLSKELYDAFIRYKRGGWLYMHMPDEAKLVCLLGKGDLATLK